MNIKKEKRFKIGGKKRLLKFGTNATSIFCDIRDLSLIQAQSITAGSMKPGQMRDLIFSALAAGALKADDSVYDIEDLDFSKWDVGDWIDEMEQSELESIHNFMAGDDKKKDKSEADDT